MHARFLSLSKAVGTLLPIGRRGRSSNSRGGLAFGSSLLLFATPSLVSAAAAGYFTVDANAAGGAAADDDTIGDATCLADMLAAGALPVTPASVAVTALLQLCCSTATP
jgi:hypothetical protein